MRASDRAYASLLDEIQRGILPAGAVVGEGELAARLAAERGDAATFAVLADEFESASLEGQAGLDAYYGLIARFDAALDESVGNDYLTTALRGVRTHLVRVRRLARDNPDRLAASVAEHRLIAAAIAAGDAELSAHATHVHLHNALANILASVELVSTGATTARSEGAA